MHICASLYTNTLCLEAGRMKAGVLPSTYSVTKHILSPKNPVQFAMSLLWLWAMTSAETLVWFKVCGNWWKNVLAFKVILFLLLCNINIILFCFIQVSLSWHTIIRTRTAFFGCTRRTQYFDIHLTKCVWVGGDMKGRTQGNTTWKK